MEVFIRFALLVLGFVIIGAIFYDSINRKKKEKMMQDLDEFIEPCADLIENPKVIETPPETDKIISLYIISKEPEGFLGPNLMAVLSAVQKRYGGMKIFQKDTFYMDEPGTLFNVASAVEPGYLEVKEMQDFATPGIILFFALSDKKSSHFAFELMLKTGKYLAARLNGELLDDNRKELVESTIEAYYNQINSIDDVRVVSG